jgi:hypothetical protein
MSVFAQGQNLTQSDLEYGPEDQTHTEPHSHPAEHPILALQRAVGNQGVQRLLQSQFQPHDAAREEAVRPSNQDDAVQTKVPPPPRVDLLQGDLQGETFATPANTHGYRVCNIRVTPRTRHIHVEGDVVLAGTSDARTIQIAVTGNDVDFYVRFPGAQAQNNYVRHSRNHVSTTFFHILNRPGNAVLPPGPYCVTFFLLPRDDTTTFRIVNGRVRVY